MIDYDKLKKIFGTKLPEAHIFFATRAVRPIVPGYSALRRAFGLSIAHTNRKVWKKFVAEYAKQTGGNTNPNDVTSVKVTGNGTNLNADTNLTLKAEVSPSTAENLGVGWRSSNASVTLAPKEGNICDVFYTGSGLNVGDKVTITAQANGSPDPEKPIEGTYVVTITASSVSVTGITLAPKTLSVGLGKKATLAATVTPSNATNPAVKWSSNATGVAIAEDTGRQTNVRGYTAGKATITGTTADGNKTDTAEVTVTAPEDGVGIAYLLLGSEGYTSAIPLKSSTNTFDDVATVTKVSDSLARIQGLKLGASYAELVTSDDAKTPVVLIVQTAANYKGFNGAPQDIGELKVGSQFDFSSLANSTSRVESSDTSILTIDNALSGTGIKAGTVEVRVYGTKTTKDYVSYTVKVVAA